jgi:hypothetical protein
MKVYHYDLNGLYQGESDANPSPLEPGKWLVPAYATLDKPPTPGAGQIAKFQNGAWSLVEDPNAILSKHVIFWRDMQGKDTAVLGGGIYSDFRMGDGSVYLNGQPADGSEGVNHTVFDTPPNGWDIKNANGVYLKKVVNGSLVDRTEVDIIHDDFVALNTKFVIFYRNASGKDKKVIDGINYGAALIPGTLNLKYKDTPLSHPSMAEIGAIVLDSMPVDWNLKNARGVPLKKVNDTNDGIEDRLQTAIDVDAENKAGIEADADQAIKDALLAATGQNMDYTTHLMIVVRAQDVLMNQGSHTQQEIDNANAVLAVYRPLFAEIQQIRADRDAKIAALEA